MLGSSGCGKTILLNAIAEFIAPSAGTVSIDGKMDTEPGSGRGMVSQDDALLPWQNVEQNIGFGLILAGVPQTQCRATVAALLDLTGLTAYDCWTVMRAPLVRTRREPAEPNMI